MLPLGFALHSFFNELPPWMLPAIPLAVLVGIAVWILLACVGLVPSSHTPWALTPIEVWLDTCCLCQDTPETIAAGIAAFDDVMRSSDRMVAFVSRDYFERLWSVYELATFCRMHPNDLGRKLLLLSLAWPSTINPLRSKRLSRAEVEQLSNFCCLDAQCYKPSDRAMLLAKIRSDWGTEAAFDDFVRNNLLAIMQQSKERYQGQLFATAVQSFELVFGD